jgi:hypothetical protein
MRNSPNKDLSWEFLRFILELENDTFYEWKFDEELNEYVSMGRRSNNPNIQSWFYMPINRTLFENQVYNVLEYQYDGMAQVVMRAYFPEEGRDEHREQSIASAMDFLRNAMENITYEIRYDESVIHSLIYPDIWLLHSGQQDIVQTLRNIQNRLELYVHE